MILESNKRYRSVGCQESGKRHRCAGCKKAVKDIKAKDVIGGKYSLLGEMSEADGKAYERFLKDGLTQAEIIGIYKADKQATLNATNRYAVSGKGIESCSISIIKNSDLVFGSSAKSTQKIMSQMNSRGWTEDLIRNTVDTPYTIRTSVNKATGNPATVFYTQQGSYVIVDDVTKAIVQISDNINPSTWVPDLSIVDPYIPD